MMNNIDFSTIKAIISNKEVTKYLNSNTLEILDLLKELPKERLLKADETVGELLNRKNMDKLVANLTNNEVLTELFSLFLLSYNNHIFGLFAKLNHIKTIYERDFMSPNSEYNLVVLKDSPIKQEEFVNVLTESVTKFMDAFPMKGYPPLWVKMNIKSPLENNDDHYGLR